MITHATQTIYHYAGLWGYFKESNLAGQFIVLCLIGMSVLTWAIMVGKYLQLQKFRVDNQRLAQELALQPSLRHIRLSEDLETPYAQVLQNVFAFVKQTPMSSATAWEGSLLEGQLERTFTQQVLRYESRMVVLGSIISAAPLLGLLGTVWGVMDTFGSVAGQASVTLQTLAPGVSGALLTTVAALLVAIPSVFGYNFLISQTKSLSLELEHFAAHLFERIQKECTASAKGIASDAA